MKQKILIISEIINNNLGEIITAKMKDDVNDALESIGFLADDLENASSEFENKWLQEEERANSAEHSLEEIEYERDNLIEKFPCETMLDEQKLEVFYRLFRNISLSEAQIFESQAKQKNKNYVDLNPE